MGDSLSYRDNLSFVFKESSVFVSSIKEIKDITD